MVLSDLKRSLPISAELPSSDNIFVDSENQNLPNFLRFLPNSSLKSHHDWFLMNKQNWNVSRQNVEQPDCEN
jgi:hypothetical protein